MSRFAHSLDHADASAADLPSIEARELEALALAVSARLRGRLSMAETRIADAGTPDARRLAEDAVQELVWLLARIDIHVAIARDHADGERVELDPALHDVLTANGKLAAFRPAQRRSLAAAARTRPAARAPGAFMPVAAAGGCALAGRVAAAR